MYDSKSCKLARSMYESSGNHGSAVLGGAALSTAVDCRIRDCSCCNHEEAAVWDHFVWRSPGFQSTRPARVPRSPMACRMCWPPRAYFLQNAKKLLHHMATVREQVTERLS